MIAFTCVRVVYMSECACGVFCDLLLGVQLSCALQVLVALCHDHSDDLLHPGISRSWTKLVCADLSLESYATQTHTQTH